jgi:dUTP pyrophosphatase
MNIIQLNPDAVIPAYESTEAAGLDLVIIDSYEIGPGCLALLNTGIAMEIDEGFCGLVMPRSSTFKKTNLIIPNSPGLIDSDYRGEILIQVLNLSREVCKLEAGTKLAQLVISPVKRASFNIVQKLGDTERGEGGFGSTDKNQ